MRIPFLIALAALPAALEVPAANAKQQREIASHCSPSGDVCTSVTTERGVLFLRMSLAAKYFSTYGLCVKGPKSKVCKTFSVRAPAKAGDSYYSKVPWRTNFRYQGPGTYRVTWDNAAAALSFELPLR